MSIARDEPGTGAAIIAVKAVPGARRDEVVGRLGYRLKVRVSAPAEDGRANRAICALLARELGVAEGRVTVATGAGTPMKSVRVEGVSAAEVESRWPG